MTVKIRVQNFQSIDDAEIEVSGLTVITGQNNSGKSAVLRAIHGAFTNARGSRFVSHGKSHCTVDVAFADGRTLTWEKGEKVNRYVVDGKTFDKVGQSVVPTEVESMGVIPITASGRDLWPQFAQQFTGQVFLLDQPGSTLAEAIADVTRVGVLNESLSCAQSDRRSRTSELKVMQSNVFQLESVERDYYGLDDVGTLIEEIESLHADVGKRTARLEGVKALQATYTGCSNLVSELAPVRAFEVPDVGGIRESLERLEGLQELVVAHGKVQHAVTSMAPLRLVPVVETAHDSQLLDELTVLIDIQAQMRPLQAFLTSVDGARSVLDQPLPDDDLTGKAQLLTTLQQLRSVIRTQVQFTGQLQAESESTDRELEMVQHEIDDALGGVGSCPICGRS